MVTKVAPQKKIEPSEGMISREMNIKKPDINQLNGEAPKTTDPEQSSYPGETEAKPVVEDVQPDQTVEHRLNELTADGSRYIQQAKTDAVRNANSRGLINSTMAAGAGTEAAIRAALPIAQQDATTYKDQANLNQNTTNDFLKNEQNAELNKDVASHQNELAKDLSAWNEDQRVRGEKIINNQKLSHETKLQYVNQINKIISDTQQQVVEIGLSDRSAEQQAQAISLAERNRDAQIKVYEDLLEAMPDWKWGTDFTPVRQQSEAEKTNYWNFPGSKSKQPVNEPPQGSVVEGYRYDGNGSWRYVGSSSSYDYANQYDY